MAARKTPTVNAVAWRAFSKTARLCREASAAGDDELRELLGVRTRRAFDAWLASEEEATGKK